KDWAAYRSSHQNSHDAFIGPVKGCKMLLIALRQRDWKIAVLLQRLTSTLANLH
ncbi:MAG: hypothetical protein QOJ04_4510, partial [Caballeronia sp.]|nr:hypothetical protein [Caballeronia sp.]